MSQAKIRSLYEGRLKTWADARSTPLAIAWENAPMNDHAPTYLRAFLLPAFTASQDLLGTHRLRVGIFQISIVCRAGQGPGEAEGIAAEIEAQFPLNLRLTTTGLTVQVISPVETARAITEPDAYILPVSFRFRADTI